MILAFLGKGAGLFFGQFNDRLTIDHYLFPPTPHTNDSRLTPFNFRLTTCFPDLLINRPEDWAPTTPA